MMTPELAPLRPESPGLLHGLSLPHATSLGDSSWVPPTGPCPWAITPDVCVCLRSWFPKRLSFHPRILGQL